MDSRLTLKMKHVFGRKSKRTSSRRPLMENNNEPADGPVFENPVNQNLINAEEERRHQMNQNTILEFLPHILDVRLPEGPSGGPSGGQTHCSVCPGQSALWAVAHMQKFWSKHFPKAPKNPDLDLQRHLSDLEEVLFSHLGRLGPLLQPHGLMGSLCECCHRQTFDHLQNLLQSVQSCRSHFVLMKWVKHTYTSHEMLSSPDIWILKEWETKATEKLLESVQKEVEGQIENILKRDKSHQSCNSAEDYVALYVDVIQCVDAKPKEAGKIDLVLCDRVRAVCFQELLAFVRRYVTQQEEVLQKKAQKDQIETIHFLKTLKTCKEIRKHIQKTRTEDVEDTLVMLKQLEDLAVKLQTEAVADAIEHNLKKYFKSDNRRVFPFAALEKFFPELTYVQDEHKTAMKEIYKAVAHIYFKQLLQRSVRSLKRCWATDVERTVQEDAQQLHRIVSARAPDVHQWNRLLLGVPEVLACRSTEALKIIMAAIQKDCQRDDHLLLPDLLRWKGLSKRAVRAVMEALPDSPPPPASTFSCFPFCCC